MTVPAKPAEPEPPKVNVPLAQSENQRARLLVDLERKFVVDPARMPPAAAADFRRRLFLSPQVCQKWRVGYLPRDVGGEDRSGGTMRGKIVYPYLSETGELLTWFGRDPEYEDKHRKWEAAGKVELDPEKFHFVKGFHLGIDLFGQHALQSPDVPQKRAGLGLIVVEGPNDVIRLDTLGVPAVALCSNAITREQAAKAAQLAPRRILRSGGACPLSSKGIPPPSLARSSERRRGVVLGGPSAAGGRACAAGAFR